MRFLAWVQALVHMFTTATPVTCEHVWADNGSGHYDLPAVGCGYDGFTYDFACSYKGCW